MRAEERCWRSGAWGSLGHGAACRQGQLAGRQLAGSSEKLTGSLQTVCRQATVAVGSLQAAMGRLRAGSSHAASMQLPCSSRQLACNHATCIQQWAALQQQAAGRQAALTQRWHAADLQPSHAAQAACAPRHVLHALHCSSRWSPRCPALLAPLQAARAPSPQTWHGVAGFGGFIIPRVSHFPVGQPDICLSYFFRTEFGIALVWGNKKFCHIQQLLPSPAAPGILAG